MKLYSLKGNENSYVITDEDDIIHALEFFGHEFEEMLIFKVIGSGVDQENWALVMNSIGTIFALVTESDAEAMIKFDTELSVCEDATWFDT